MTKRNTVEQSKMGRFCFVGQPRRFEVRVRLKIYLGKCASAMGLQDWRVGPRRLELGGLADGLRGLVPISRRG